MRHWYQKPHPLLAPFVRNVLLVEGFSPVETTSVPLFAKGIPAFYVRIEQPMKEGSALSQMSLYGKSVPDDQWTTNVHTAIIAYFFKPFALATVFNVQAARLAKESIELDHWRPQVANALKLQLAYATSTENKVEVLNNLLIQLSGENERECNIIRYATDQMMYHSGTEVLSSIQEDLQITERTFQRLFKKFVGISPNQYRRICQIQSSFAQIRSRQFDQLSDVAYENGFADQSHFIRSFKEYTKTTPQRYLRDGLNGDSH